MDDLYVKAPKFGGIIRESPSIHFVYKKWGLRDGSDSEHDSEANFKHGGHKRHETVPTDIGLSLEDDFFDDIETYLTELAKLDEVFFIFFPPFFLNKRQYLSCPVFNPSLFVFLFFSFF